MRYASVMDLPPGMREQAQRQLNESPTGIITFVKDSPALTDARSIAGASSKEGVSTASAAPAKPSKYRNTRVFLEGEWFDSKLEYDCWTWLNRRKAAGEIAYIKRQVTFVLEGGVKYRADYEAVLTFAYALKVAECSEVWDAKGKDTQASINKRKQVKARYGVEVRLWTKADR